MLIIHLSTLYKFNVLNIKYNTFYNFEEEVDHSYLEINVLMNV